MDTNVRTQPVTGFPLPTADLESLGIRRGQIDRLIALIEAQDDRYDWPAFDEQRASNANAGLQATCTLRPEVWRDERSTAGERGRPGGPAGRRRARGVRAHGPARPGGVARPARAGC